MGNQLLIGVLAILLFSCQPEKQQIATSSESVATSQTSDNRDTKNSAQNDGSNERNPERDKALAIKSIENSLKQKIFEEPEFRKAVQKILLQPEKFNNLVEACSVKNFPNKIYRHSIGFTNFFKISDEKYILHLQCYTGAYQPGGVYFLFSNTDGIQTKPLVLTKLVGYETGKPKEIPISDGDSQSITGYHKFNQDKKELSLLQRCDGQWRCFGKSRYTFVDDQLVLQEYIVGSRDISSRDIDYRTFQFIRDKDGWVSSGKMKCREIDLKTCRKVTNP